MRGLGPRGPRSQVRPELRTRPLLTALSRRSALRPQSHCAGCSPPSGVRALPRVTRGLVSLTCRFEVAPLGAVWGAAGRGGRHLLPCVWGAVSGAGGVNAAGP